MIKDQLAAQFEEHGKEMQKMIKQAVNDAISGVLLNSFGKEQGSVAQQSAPIPSLPLVHTPSVQEMWINSPSPRQADLPIVSSHDCPPFKTFSDDQHLLECMVQTYKGSVQSMAWKSNQQRDLLMHILHTEGNAVGILPTGGGKSAVFEVPSHTWQREKTTVVIVPFRALLDQFQSNNKSRGTNCIHYVDQNSQHKSPAPPPSLIFVSVEIATQEQFIE
jgi:DEAD/DEAH box helicase